MKNLKIIFILFIILINLDAKELGLNIKSYIYKTQKELNLDQLKEIEFKLLKNNHINFGFNSKSKIWLKLTIKNNNPNFKDFFLILDNPLLEKIILYKPNNSIEFSGMLEENKKIISINPSFKLHLDKDEEKTFYLNIKNTTTALQFSILLKDLKTFEKDNSLKEFLIVIFIGMVLSFILYSTCLFFYTKKRSYLYYSIYMITIVFQQLTYVGFLPLYMPMWFINIDNLIVVPKVGLMIITAAIFARSFLKTANFFKIDTIYKYIIYLSVLIVILFSTQKLYFPELIVLTGLFFVFFNFFAAIYIYKKGNKQARFFIVGWFFLLIGYFLMIIDSLGIISIMHFLPMLILVLTLIEAVFLLLAFVDKLKILQNEKDELDKKLYKELEKRKNLVEKEVQEQTKTLKTLYKELHHRVKNNLQIILSILDLQSAKLDNNHLKNEFLKLENRIKAIAKTHEILYQYNNIETISMGEYLDSLCFDINTSYSKSKLKFNIETDISLSLKKAVYIGIIVNELVSNSIKHAKSLSLIDIKFFKSKNKFYLKVCDDGEGYDKNKASSDSLGLNLVKSLVLVQLDGEIKSNTTNKCEYTIRFDL